jgi:3D (Asp-Asp-Asp) domain-containing protein
MQCADLKYHFPRHACLGLVMCLFALGCDARGIPDSKSQESPRDWQTLEVLATAYTLAEDETKKGNVGLAAWGDRLKPGMKAIAVSRDLIPKGLDHRTRVKIEGLPGTYVVRDKMNRRWRNKVDILVKNKRRAREWGKRPVVIRWLDAGES